MIKGNACFAYFNKLWGIPFQSASIHNFCRLRRKLGSHQGTDSKARPCGDSFVEISTRSSIAIPTKPVLLLGHLAPFLGCMAASAEALVLSVSAASDAPASSGARAFAEGRDWRGRKPMEETMRVLTINELMRLT
jgi:hypothetical protein